MAGESTQARTDPQEAPISPAALLFNGLQHVAIIAPIGLVSPLLIVRLAGADAGLQAAVIGATLLALGLGSFLLCARGRLLGSGYLSPAIVTAAYLPSSLAAALVGGLPLVFGMTIFAGFCEIAFSFILRRLRPFLPAEIAGLAVVMIGLTLGLLGFRLLVGLDGHPSATAADLDGLGLALGLFTLALIVVLNIWGKGRLRTFSVLIGLVAGYLLATLLGHVDLVTMGRMSTGELVKLPTLPLLWPAFDLALVPPFLVGALACALRATGDITTCQRIADTNWTRPDLGSIGRGIRADGIATIIAGLLGTLGMNTSSSSIGLSQATGVIQRRVGFAIGGIFILLAFLPPVVSVAASLPTALSGAILLFSSSFILANGLSIIVGRLLDSRRILAIGIALILGISHDVFLEFYRTLPAWLHSISGSSLVVAMVVALTFNAVFRLGIRRSAKLAAPIDHDLLSRVLGLCREQGPLWGARREMMARVENALTEAVELGHARGRQGESFTLRLNYDEFRIGATVDFPSERLDQNDQAFEEHAVEALRLAELELRLMRHFADRVTLHERDGRLTLRLVFED